METPYIYLLARSGAAVKDQILYVPTRLEDLKEMDVSVSLQDGTEYTDTMRFFSGDTPARQLEAGQQCGGTFERRTLCLMLNLHMLCIMSCISIICNRNIWHARQSQMYNFSKCRITKTPNLIRRLCTSAVAELYLRRISGLKRKIQLACMPFVECNPQLVVFLPHVRHCVSNLRH